MTSSSESRPSWATSTGSDGGSLAPSIEEACTHTLAREAAARTERDGPDIFEVLMVRSLPFRPERTVLNSEPVFSRCCSLILLLWKTKLRSSC